MPAKTAGLETLKVGDVAITYVPDGQALVSGEAFFPASTSELWDHHRSLFAEDGRLLLTFGGFLIETGDRRILVDLAMGPVNVEFPPINGLFEAGDFLTNLRGHGVQPDEIDTVFYTHMHLDHVGWTSGPGGLTFANARHTTGDGEFAYWRDLAADHPLAAVGPDRGAVVDPLAGRIESLSDGAVLAPGINVVATPGHTPGHCSLVISSAGERAILLGDVIHCPIQLTDNDQAIAFDFDPALAARTRERMAADLESDPSTTAAPCHFSESVFGRIIRSEGKRRWYTGRAHV